MQIFFPYPQTPESVKRLIRSNGLSVAEIARTLNVDRGVVNSLLDGNTRGSRGQSHIAAIALGIKEKPANPFTKAKPPRPKTPSRRKAAPADADKTQPCPKSVPTLQPAEDQL